MSWGAILQSIGIILMASGSILAIEGLWSKRFKKLAEESDKKTKRLATSIVFRFLLSPTKDKNLLEEIKGTKYEELLLQSEKSSIHMFLIFVENLILEFINKYFVHIGAVLICTGAIIGVIGINI